MSIDFSLTPTIELLAELEKRHIAMVFIGIPYSSHNNPEAGDAKVVKDIKGNTLLIIGLCETMKQASVFSAIENAQFGKDLQD